VLVYGECSSCANPAARADYDADNKVDGALYDKASATFFINRSFVMNVPVPDRRAMKVPFGNVGDVPLSGDFDGDGRADVALWRDASFTFFVQPSSLESATSLESDFNRVSSYKQTLSQAFGSPGDIPVPADYDGDGKTDFAVRHDSTFTTFIRRSTDGGTTTVPFGNPGDVPITGDFDGDKKADVAVRRDSTIRFFIRRSSDGGTTTVPFGNPGDIPAVGDYDGDGKSDVAVRNDSVATFFVQRSTNGTTLALPFGNPGDIPVPGDYDGDGLTDAAVRRPSDGRFYILRSSDGGTTTIPFGNLDMVPVGQLIANPKTPAIKGR
jgi:hypothetical protein